jgi:polysaccharide biosynthesis transport protein
MQSLPSSVQGPSTPVGAESPEREFSLRNFWGVLARNRFLILTALVAVPIVSSLLAALMTPVYQSELSMRIDEKKSGLPVLEALSALTDQAGELNTEMQMLRSRVLAEQTVDSLALQVLITTPLQVSMEALLGGVRKPQRSSLLSFVKVARSEDALSYRLERQPNYEFAIRDREKGTLLTRAKPGDLVTLGPVQMILAPGALRFSEFRLDVKPFGKAVTTLGSQLTIRRPQREANFVTVRYQSADQGLVSEVPNVLAANFLAMRNQIMKTEARSTVRFLKEQIDTLSKQVVATENALRSFREGNQVVSLAAEASVRVTELTRLQSERNAKIAERDALNRALREAQQESTRNGTDSASAYRSLIAFPTLIGTNAGQFLQALNEAENQRAVLLQRRTRQDRDVQVLTGRIRELERQLSQNVQTYVSGLTSQIASLDAALSQYGQQMEKIPSKEMQFVRLERQNKVLSDIYMLLQTRLQEAQIAQATEDSRVRVIDAAIVPLKRLKPNRVQYLIFGALFGLAVGIGLAMMRETLDRTVHSREEMVQLTGAPSLGLIPHIEPIALQRRREAMALGSGIGALPPSEQLAVNATGNPITEAYRTLRTNITYSSPDQTLKTLVLTSPTPGDGKSTTAANLASTLSHQGHRVLLVDGDMRRGTLHHVFGIPREPGLSNVLIGAATLEECVHTVKSVEFGVLQVIPCGVLPPNPSELYSGRRMTEFIARAESEFDIVIFDTPPVTLVTDAAIVGTMTSGVILIGRAGHTDKGAIAYAAEQLRNVRAPIVGTVLNDFDFRRDIRYSSYGSPGYAYYGNYSYGYGTGSGNGSANGSILGKIARWVRRAPREHDRVG